MSDSLMPTPQKVNYWKRFGPNKGYLVHQRYLNAELREDYEDALANEETALSFEDWVRQESILANS